jgi:hypothetical protein
MIERNIFCDLTLDEVAMILHTFLKKLEGSYQTVSTHIEKIEYDINYVENFNIFFDIRIIFKTIGAVFSKSNVEFTKADLFSESSITTKEKEQVLK